MKVYVLQHDDRSYDMGDQYVRGVYATEDAADGSLVTRTASGRKSRAWGAHDENCCGVQEWEVATAPNVQFAEDPPPPDPNSPAYKLGLLSVEVMGEMVRTLLTESPYRR